MEIKREAFSLYDNYSFRDELNNSKEEHVDLKDLSTSNDLIIQKSDKNNSVFLQNKNDYIKQMNEMLYDSSKFKKLDIKPGKEINSLNKHMEFCNWELFYRLIIDLKTTFTSKILFLKHYDQV